MMKPLYILLFLLLSNNVLFAQTKYCDKIDNEERFRKTYLTISYSNENKIPNYVGYYITEDNIKGNVGRESKFYTESLVQKRYQAKSSDYTNSGYDRGHMSPAADWKGNSIAMHDSFSMANICPQKPMLNRQYWKEIENTERELTEICDTLYIISGAICKEKKYINNGVRIPDEFYKTIVGVKNGNIMVSIGWVFENTNEEQPPEEHKCTVDYIEDLINHDLYHRFWFNNLYENEIIMIW